MLRKMDDTSSSFKIKLERTHWGNYRFSIPPPPKTTMLKPGWIIYDPE